MNADEISYRTKLISIFASDIVAAIKFLFDVLNIFKMKLFRFFLENSCSMRNTKTKLSFHLTQYMEIKLIKKEKYSKQTTNNLKTEHFDRI